ncbi:MAG: repair protein RecN [Pseudonocardiales bacterium]|nr:repair protein RecN [Pseudonocardiales bacterium]
MLEELRIRGLGVIDDAVLPLGRGLTVVTGETGAGKTMVVTGLLLLFGGRADAARVRSGAERASIDGRLEIDADSPAAQRARGAGGDLDDGTGLVLRRDVSAAGRSRAYVGGASVPVAVLGELAERLLAVHGQADQLRLTRPGQQRAALDRFAGVDLAEYAKSFERWRAAAATLADRTARAGELRREADLLAYGIAEIDAAAPQPDEDVELGALASRLAHADGLRLAARTAHDALLGDPDDPAADVGDAGSLLGVARRALEQQAGADPELDALAIRLTELSALTADTGADLLRYGEGLDADPDRLAQIEARRAVLGDLARKYADPPHAGIAAVLDWVEQARARLADLDVSDEALAALQAARDDAEAETTRRALALTGQRLAAAAQLGTAVTAELAGLAMPSAQLTVEVSPRSVAAGGLTLHIDGAAVGAGPDGADEVDFVLRPHAEAPPLPIGRGASGGELSRVMLALEVCLAGTDPVPTMVFDEVDAGVGGRAAIEVGRRLARLARDHQVIVVTHLPQVAAYADRQIVVDKPLSAQMQHVTASDVRIVTGEDRITELARMLAGSDSSTAREHATELLASAAADRKAAPKTPAPRRMANRAT